MGNQRLKALDGIRGGAAVIVAFFWHYKSFFGTEKPFHVIGYWPYNFGWIMVDLFFVLSGFIFYTIYGKQIRENKLDVKSFLVLRLSRLYPLHFLTLCIVCIFGVLQHCFVNIYIYNGYTYRMYDFIINIVMAQNGWFTTNYSFNAPSWSISIEFMLYLLFFYIFYNSGDAKKYIANSIIIIYFGAVIYLSKLSMPFFNSQTARGLMGFFIGIITGELYNYFNKNTKYKKTALLICGIGVIATTLVPSIIGYSKFKGWELITASVLFPSFIFIVLNSKFLSKILSIKPLVYLGELSYSIYLLHYPAVLVIRNINNQFDLSLDYSSNIFYIAYFTGVIIISHISHYCFENPLQNYLRVKLIN
ncbi:MAG: acyltransferase [Spirochaetaceae bacterium]|jgi:peptidoglycan/LPS O-acetylase OafA/YrhL|nr:acyltransferase [Spirochaetaceae bacterium]